MECRTYGLLQTVEGVHLRTGFQQGLGLGQTKATAGAGDANDLAGETELGHARLVAHHDGLGSVRGSGSLGGFNGDGHCDGYW